MLRYWKYWQPILGARYIWIILLLLLLAFPISLYSSIEQIELLKANQDKVWKADQEAGRLRAVYNYDGLHLYCPYGGEDGGALRIMPEKDALGQVIIPLNTGVAWNSTLLKNGLIKQKVRKLFFSEEGYLLFTAVSKSTQELKLTSPRKKVNQPNGTVTIDQNAQPFSKLIPHYWGTGDTAEDNLLIVFADYTPFDKSEITKEFEATFKKEEPINLNAAELFFRSSYPSSIVYYFKTSAEVPDCDYYLRIGKKI